MNKLTLLGIIGGAAFLTAVPYSLQWSQKKVALSANSAHAQVLGFGLYSGGYSYGGYGYGYPDYSYGGYGYGYPAYSYGGYGYGYPAYSYGGYYRPALYGGYLGYRIARRVAIHRARWR